MIKDSKGTEEFLKFFEKLPKLIKPKEFSRLTGIAVSTVYDWHYRVKEKDVPPEMFVKISRSLFLRTDILLEWMKKQNPLLS